MGQLFTRTCTNQTTNWLMHSWNIFGAWMNHGQTHITRFITTRIWGKPPPSHLPHLGYEACTQMSFFPRTPKLGILKFLKLRLLQFWKPITFCLDVRLKWGLKESCNHPWELFNNMWHTACTKTNQGDFWLLVVWSQIDSLIPNPSFGHSLCF